MWVRAPPAAGRRPGSSAARQPDPAEVVDARDLLDEVEVDVRERPAGGHARVVDERLDGRVTLEDACRERLDGRAVADVARLRLAAGLLGQRLQPVFAAGDEDAVPAARREQARGRLADPGGRTCDDRDALHGANVTQMPSAQSVSPQPTLRALRYSAPSRFETVRRSSPSVVQRSSTTWPWRRSGRRRTRALGRGWASGMRTA